MFLKNKKKKKQNQSWSHTEVEIIMDEETIKKRLKGLFKAHIGAANSISPYQLFEKVYGVSPQECGRFKAEYWYIVLKKVMRAMRMSNELYTTFKGRKVFVLQSQDELAYTQHTIDRHITALKVSRKNAEIWVREAMWKSFAESKE